MLNRLKCFFKDEAGATAIEYGLLIALISVAILVSLTTMGKSINNTFNKESANLATAR